MEKKEFITITTVMLSQALNISMEQAKDIIEDLKYAGFLMAMSDGETIEIALPDMTSNKFKEQKQHMQEYEENMPTRDELIKLGLVTE
jgi:predicted transcriptional regulator